MFIIVLIGLFITSFILSLFSLMKEMKKPKEIELTKKELMKEKVLFIKD